MRPLARICTLAVILFAVTGCVSLEEGTAQAPDGPTATPLPSTDDEGGPNAGPTVAPTVAVNPDVQRIFFTYQHPTSVFNVSIPETWSVGDDTTDERIQVELEPPLGFASRVTVDIVRESDLTPEELAALQDGYVEQRYSGDDNYTEINRADQPDGTLQVTLLYNNPAGASGRETVYLRLAGPYFSALRIFVSDNEAAAMSEVMERIADSFTLNPTARWGEPEVPQIGPQDLAVEGLNGWSDAPGNYHIAGRIRNTWVEDVGFLALSAGVCDANGVVLEENSVILRNEILPQDGVAPFEVLFGPVEDVEGRPCLIQPRAEPASRLDAEPYVAFEVEPDIRIETVEIETGEGETTEEQRLVVAGTALNIGDETAQLIDVILAVYNGPAELPETPVIGYAVTSVDAPQLGPGEASLFSHTFNTADLGAGPETAASWTIEFWVQGSRLLPTPTPDSAPGQPTPAG